MGRSNPPALGRVKHDWTCMGGGGGWEVWECRRCSLTAIPSIFGFLWPTVLQWLLPSFRCEQSGDSAT